MHEQLLSFKFNKYWIDKNEFGAITTDIKEKTSTQNKVGFEPLIKNLLNKNNLMYLKNKF